MTCPCTRRNAIARGLIERIRANPGCSVSSLTRCPNVETVVEALRILDEAELIVFKNETTSGGFPYRTVYLHPASGITYTDEEFNL